MLDIESIKAREQAATKGPWEAVSLDEYGVRYVGDEEEYHPAWTVPQAMQIGNGESAFMLREDAEFAAHAREDIRALIAEVERLKKCYSEIYMGVWLASEDEVDFSNEAAAWCRAEAERQCAKLRNAEAAIQYLPDAFPYLYGKTKPANLPAP